jgi:non-specific serine/threonine protein kinase
MRHLAREADNLQAVLRRCLEGGDIETGLRVAGATWRYWQAAGMLAEARAWLARLLEQPGGTEAVRAKALTSAAGSAYWQADYASARADYEAALALYQALGDRANEADVLWGLSMTATWSGDPEAGERLAAEARSRFDDLGLRTKVSETSMAQGFALWQQRQYEAARPLWEDALAISREEGADTLALTQLAGLAGLEFHTGAPADATRIALDALDQAGDLENIALCVWLLDFVAAFTVASDAVAAVRVAGAADALRQTSGGGMRVEDLHITPARTAAARTLDRAELARAWNEGRSLSLEEAMDAARSLHPVSIG